MSAQTPLARFFRCPDEPTARRAFESLIYDPRLGNASAFRLMGRRDARWYIALAGLPVDVARAAGALDVDDAAPCPAPEPGLAEATIARWGRHTIETVATGRRVGRRHYPDGMELGPDGRMRPPGPR